MSRYSVIEKCLFDLRSEGYSFNDDVYKALVKERALLESGKERKFELFEEITPTDLQKVCRFLDVNNIEYKYGDGAFIFRKSDNVDWNMMSFSRVKEFGAQAAIEQISLRLSPKLKLNEEV